MDGRKMCIEHERSDLAAEYLKTVTQYAPTKNSNTGLHGLSVAAVWVPPPEMCLFETNDDRIEYNPYVAFNAHVVPQHRQ